MAKMITYDSIEDAILGTVDMAVWTKTEYRNANMLRRHGNWLDNFIQMELNSWYEQYQWSRRDIVPWVTYLFAQRLRKLPDDVVVARCLGRPCAFDDECEVYATMYKFLVA